MLQLVPILGVLAGIIIPVSVFIWLYFEGKDKNRTIIKIAKHMDDPSKAEEFLRILDERKKEPIDYRRGGVITMFVGIGIYILGFTYILIYIFILFIFDSKIYMFVVQLFIILFLLRCMQVKKN